MKIIQTSNIHLGRSFAGTGLPGEKMRAAIKSAFSRIIDLAVEQSADLVILAGDTFDNIDISQNMLEFFITEINRLGKIPAVMLPGSFDNYDKGSFWASWLVTDPTENLHILAGRKGNIARIAEKSLKVYGYPPSKQDNQEGWPRDIDADKEFKYHVAVIYGKEGVGTESALGHGSLITSPFDYMALGGHNEYKSLVGSGVKAAFSGSPVALAASWRNSGNTLIVDVEKDSVNVTPFALNGVVWKEMEIAMSTVANLDDLKGRIAGLAGENVVLKVTLTGLALLETEINIDCLLKDLEGLFLKLEFVDTTNVLPDNVSEIKVQEKTLTGQYLKVMVEKLNNSSGQEKAGLEESLKVGYSLLSGRELW
jgi:DNA repair exonuclease SbcCD nuclease subunit